MQNEAIGVMDDADAIAQLCISISMALPIPVDTLLNEPFSRLPLYQKEFERRMSGAKYA